MKHILTAGLLFLFNVTAYSQNVGIGTATPNAKAQLDISSTTRGLLLPRMTAAQRLAINPAANAVSLMVFDTDSSAFMFWTGSGWNKLNEKVRTFWVDAGNGNIATNNTGFAGIGTSTPTHQLSVVHNGGKGILVKSSSGFSAVDIDAAQGDAALRFLNNDTLQWSVRNQPGTNDLQFFETSNLSGPGSERLKIQDVTGNIGINQTNPVAKLDVNGNFKLSDGTQGAGKVLISDASGLASWQSQGGMNAWAISGNNIYNNNAGNVGIGTSTPGFPLNFSNALGDKISLYGNSGFHYGFGIQGGLLQIHSDAAAANIAFGYGSSSSFVERMRIINSGLEGMTLDGRLTIRNGQPANAGGGGGVWLTKPDNSALLGFMGTQNSQNIGFFGGPGGWGFTYDAINSRVGIGNNNPKVPLAFGAVGGKKITLFPGASGDAGFGVASNRLQIYADNPNADVAIGYDAAGTFNERFAFKPNGALAVNGSTGFAGQILQSNGSGNAATWVGKPYVFRYTQTAPVTTVGVQNRVPILGIDNNTFVMQHSGKIIFHPNCLLIGSSIVFARFIAVFEIVNFSNTVVQIFNLYGSAPTAAYESVGGTCVTESLPPGVYTLRAYISRYQESDVPVRCEDAMVVIQVVPD